MVFEIIKWFLVGFFTYNFQFINKNVIKELNVYFNCDKTRQVVACKCKCSFKNTTIKKTNYPVFYIKITNMICSENKQLWCCKNDNGFIILFTAVLLTDLEE